jgi:hypothetical protein
MNILVLINDAEQYRPFFVELGKALSGLGHKLTFALDSQMSEYTYPDFPVPPDARKYIFSDYFRKNRRSTLDPKFQSYNVWSTFLPDFERLSIYGLHKKTKRTYFRDILATMYAFFDEIFEQEKIDIVIFETVSNVFGYTAYNVANSRGKKYVWPAAARMPGRFEIFDSIFHQSRLIAQTFQDSLQNQDKIQWPEEILTYVKNINEAEPDYMKNNPFSPTVSLKSRYLNSKKFRYLVNILRYVKANPEDQQARYQMADPLLYSYKMVVRSIQRALRLKYLTNYYDEQDSADDFYLYPIQFHPESSSSVLAPHCLDEYNVILGVASSIPFGCYLYVKDHRSAAGYPTLDFYKKLKRIPNVKVLHYNSNTKDLIRRSKGVITSTSTVGFEALVLRKPVYVLGRILYEFHPNCRKIDCYWDLFQALQKDFDQDFLSKPDMTLPFLYAYYKHTFKGKVDAFESKIPAFLVDSIAAFIVKRHPSIVC